MSDRRIDGLPVDDEYISFTGTFQLKKGEAAKFVAGEPIPLVVLASVADVHYVIDPGIATRTQELAVTHYAIPTGEMEGALLAFLRDDPIGSRFLTRGPFDVVAPPEGSDAVFDVVRDGTSIFTGNQPADSITTIVGTTAAAPEPLPSGPGNITHSADDDSIKLPPPPSDPDGEVTLRRITPGDPEVAKFMREKV